MSNTSPIAETRSGWPIRRGDTRPRTNGPSMVIVGREGNVILARQLAPPSLVGPPKPDLVPVVRIHPSELGLKSNIQLPAYARGN